MARQLYDETRFYNYRELVNYVGDTYGDHPSFIIKKNGENTPISAKTFRDTVYAMCSAFIKAGYLGKSIAVSGKNSYEWSVTYIAAACIGRVVPIDKEVSSQDCAEFLKAADCVACFADKKIIAGIEKVGTETALFDISYVWDIDMEVEPEIREQIDSIEYPANECQILIFTSGTTGSSKGVCLSQNNVCFNIYQTVRMVKISTEDTVLSLLPLHHTYECTLDCLLILSKGGTITYCGGLTKIARNLHEYQPTVLVVVPAVLEMLERRIRKSVSQSLPKMFARHFDGNSLGVAMKKLPFFLRNIVKKKVRAELGGKLRMFIVGAAAVDPVLIESFNTLGIITLQGYGLTECAPLLAGNCDFFLNPASTGKAIPDVEIMIDNPNAEGIGEILARGENIMLGYFNDQDATDAVFKGDWFRTGDLGYIDDEGYLYIKGRLKNVIVTSNGKNIYPEELEKRILDHKEFIEALVLGTEVDGETVVKAKIMLNTEVLAAQNPGLNIKDNEALHAAIKPIINEINDSMQPYKKIKVYEIVDSFEKTTTAKVKRYGDNMK